MTKQKENRRVRMTKQLIKDAFLDLLEQKDLKKISVTAICETADVNRSTFYNYYSDPIDLLNEIEQDYLDHIPTASDFPDQMDQKELVKNTSAFFDFVKQNEKVSRILFNDSISSHFSSNLVDFIYSGKFVFKENKDDLTFHYYRLYIANGAVGMLRDWVKNGFPVSSLKIAEMMYSLSNTITQI